MRGRRSLRRVATAWSSSSTGVSAATALRWPTQMAQTDMNPTNQSAFRKVSQSAVPGTSQKTMIQKLIARRCFGDVRRAIHSGGPYQTRRNTF